jgi:tripartite-type tricarboxylate transporter receptor subunit TctC
MHHRGPLLAITTALSALTILAAAPAQAVELPCSTAKLIVPWGAGGDTDIIFRLLVDQANKEGAKPKLQVVNVSGQGCVCRKPRFGNTDDGDRRGQVGM